MHPRVHDHDAEAKGLQLFGRRLPRCEEPLSTIQNTRRAERTMPGSSHRRPADRKAVLPRRDSKTANEHGAVDVPGGQVLRRLHRGEQEWMFDTGCLYL